MPHLSENCLDVPAWFRKFDLYCKMQTFLKSDGQGDQRAEFLAMHLEGMVATSHSQLPADIQSDYELCKMALIKRYGLKPSDAYRKFVTSRYVRGVALDGFVDELRKLLDSVINVPVDAKNALVLNQFLIAIPEEAAEKLTIACDVNGDLTLDDVLEKARAMLLFRPSTTPVTILSAAAVTRTADTRARSVISKEPDGKPKEARRCYNCNGVGHLSKDCPKPRRATKNLSEGASSSQ